MKKIVSLLILVNVFITAECIDFGNKYFFDIQGLIGKRIIIPTYNGGDNVLRFAYNLSTLDSKKFTYKNYYSSPILGEPIKILDYKILDEGKKKEALCIVVEHNNEKCVLRFPTNPKEEEYEDCKVHDLFYYVGPGTSNSYKDIDLNYILADDMEQYLNSHKDSICYIMASDAKVKGKKHIFKNFSFLKTDKEIYSFDQRKQVVMLFGGYGGNNILFKKKNGHYLDDFYAVLTHDSDVYIKIKGNGGKNENDNTIDIASLSKILLSEVQYKETFADNFGRDKIMEINDTLVGRNFYLHYADDNRDYKIFGKSHNSNYWSEKSLYSISRKYYDMLSLKQLKTIEFGEDKYYFYAIGVEENTKDTIAISLKDNLLALLSDGFSHKEEVSKEESQRALIEAKVAREEKEYERKLIKRYGASNAALILDGRVKVGFTKEMCEEAWGIPDDINTTITQNRRWEQWVYGIGCYLYFEGNRLVVIQK